MIKTAIYQVFDEPVLGYKEVQVAIVNPEDAQGWIENRKRIPCYAEDNYVAREVKIDKGNTEFTNKEAVSDKDGTGNV